MAVSHRHPLIHGTPSGVPQGNAPWQEMLNPATGTPRPHWQHLAPWLQHALPEVRASLTTQASRMVKELGTTYNVFSDAGGAGQPYELDPIPLPISEADWLTVRTGLEQRARLLDAVLADLFGPQSLLASGLVPPDLIHSSKLFPHFARGVQPVGGHYLMTIGCDLLRSPTGQWTVLRDHTGTPGGLGQVLENRSVTANLLPASFDAFQPAPLLPFLELEREVLESLAPPRHDLANLVFLTPGFRHPSFFEHAYKAKLLGIPLVEAADLTVRERRLFLKTLSGLRRVDAVICRVDESGIDPLESWGGSADGIPGIIEAWRSGNVALANAPGSGFASSPALLPFLPGICRSWFGEEMILPFVETWWLGQPEVRRTVLKEAHRFILLNTDPKSQPLLPLDLGALNATARRQWLAEVERNPHDFVVQTAPPPSETPALTHRNLKPCPVVWRAFTLLGPDGPTALPGGLARIGKAHLPPQLWPTHAGFTKDVWVNQGEPNAVSKPALSHRSSHSSQASEVPSRIAEQLFWLGRYAERIELTTRLLRVILRNLGSEMSGHPQRRLAACIDLFHGCALFPESFQIPTSNLLPALAELIHSPKLPGGLPALSQALLFNAAAARDRLSDDTWRFFNRLETIVRAPETTPSPADLLATLDTLVLHLAAFAGMQAENMTRGHGWRFLELGRRLERALNVLALLQTTAKRRSAAEHDPILNPLLETCDSGMTYRRRHFSEPRLRPVIDLLYSDATNPRSVARQMQVLREEASNLPGRQDFGLMPRILLQIHEIEILRSQAAHPSVDDFTAVAEALEQFSDLLTQQFFSHSVRRVY